MNNEWDRILERRAIFLHFSTTTFSRRDCRKSPQQRSLVSEFRFEMGISRIQVRRVTIWVNLLNIMINTGSNKSRLWSAKCWKLSKEGILSFKKLAFVLLVRHLWRLTTFLLLPFCATCCSFWRPIVKSSRVVPSAVSIDCKIIHLIHELWCSTKYFNI